jgi:DivIVA domain-containing protein
MADAPRQPQPKPRAKPAAPRGGILERLRGADFSLAVRGYDRHQVDEFLSGIAKRLEAESGSLADPDAVKRKLEEVGQSTTEILTAAEQTARKLQEDASTEAAKLRKSATETAEHAREEAREFANSTRERATEEGRRILAEANQKAQQLVAAAEARSQELLNRSLERRQVLAATIERLDARRVQLIDELRQMAGELEVVAEEGEDVEPIEAVEPQAPIEPAPTEPIPAQELPTEPEPGPGRE